MVSDCRTNARRAQLMTRDAQAKPPSVTLAASMIKPTYASCRIMIHGRIDHSSKHSDDFRGPTRRGLLGCHRDRSSILIVEMTTATKRGGRSGSLTVEKAVDLLERIAASPEGIRNLDLAREAGLDKSTSHRLLATLERRGLVHRDPRTMRFVLGTRLLELATGVAISSTLVARPYLHELVQLTGESASFSLLAGGSYLCVDAVQAPHEIRFALELGRPYPLNAGATGKVILAFNRQAARRVLQGELPRYAANTIVSADRLKAQLAEIRRRGFASSEGERVAGGCSIAAPVPLSGDAAIGALAVSSVGSRLDLDGLSRHADAVRASAAELSERILRPHG
ncbi:MAG: helix-turn-helix domain-containing protein [Streptosporangiales bacterium]|nr:helix-turn-helix domain-containing protein [Streptosporangiales bacterium]